MHASIRILLQLVLRTPGSFHMEETLDIRRYNHGVVLIGRICSKQRIRSHREGRDTRTNLSRDQGNFGRFENNASLLPQQNMW